MIDNTLPAVTVARKGTDVIVVGLFGDEPVVDMGTVQDREPRLIGTRSSPFERTLEADRDANLENSMKAMIDVGP